MEPARGRIQPASSVISAQGRNSCICLVSASPAGPFCEPFENGRAGIDRCDPSRLSLARVEAKSDVV